MLKNYRSPSSPPLSEDEEEYENASAQIDDAHVTHRKNKSNLGAIKRTFNPPAQNGSIATELANANRHRDSNRTQPIGMIEVDLSGGQKVKIPEQILIYYASVPNEEQENKLIEQVIAKQTSGLLENAMGLSGADATFQRLLEEIIGDLEPYAHNYLDDIVLATESFDEHMHMLRKLILKIKDSGLTINREKSKFCCNEVKFMGFKVNEHRLMMDPDKTTGITN